MSSPPDVRIEGSPVLSGRALSPTDKLFLSLRTPDDYGKFARSLRGQFSIIVRSQTDTIGITDFCGSLPIYYVRSGGTWETSTKLSTLRSHCDGRIERKGLFFFAARGGVGVDPLYAGVRQVYPGRVIQLEEGGAVREDRYVNWFEMPESTLDLAEACRTFVALASSYLAAATANEERVGCLLSGGTDSAITAWLLKRIHPKVTCFTADYAISRYSEYAEAQHNARQLGVEQARVVVTRRDHWSAFERMNGITSDVPTNHSQLTSLIKIGEVARERGIRTLVSGDNADTLFMGLEGFFDRLPPVFDAYARATEEMTIHEKLERVVRWHPLDRRGREILGAFGIGREECEKWMETLESSGRKELEPLAARSSLWRLQQISGQQWAGVPYQLCWLPTERTVPGVRLISPYLDADMVRFGISLPLPLKYQNGVKKFLLHHILESEAGIKVKKRASPNPSRLWTLVPPLSLLGRIDSRLRKSYVSECARNLVRRGSLHNNVSSVAALGLWLRAHRLQAVA